MVEIPYRARGQLHYRLVGAQDAGFVEGLLQTIATFGGEPTAGM